MPSNVQRATKGLLNLLNWRSADVSWERGYPSAANSRVADSLPSLFDIGNVANCHSEGYLFHEPALKRVRQFVTFFM